MALMVSPLSRARPNRLDEPALAQLIGQVLDPAWYQERYPDIVAANLDPLLHFLRYGAAERRDPNGFFDSIWYVEHYPDVAASGLNPLQHYLLAGAAELRNPHPRFDAVYYVDQHPAAAPNPLLHHLQVGATLGYLTEKPIDIRDYLPSLIPPLPPAQGVFADVVIVAYRGFDDLRRCIASVLADRSFPLGRIIVVDDRTPESRLGIWLRELAFEGQIHLIRNHNHLGFAASASLGIEAAEGHDVVLLSSNSEVPAGWLRRLSAHAYAQPNIASVSPLSDRALSRGYPAAKACKITSNNAPDQTDKMCETINSGRSADVATTVADCMYVRRTALLAVGAFDRERSSAGDSTETSFCLRATRAGWRHRIACDTFVLRNGNVSAADLRQPNPGPGNGDVIPFRFAVTAALFRQSKLPVILMITHSFGGGIRRHINSLMERYQDAAHVMVLEGSDRGAMLSVPSLTSHPVLTLPPDRLGDLVTVLRSANLSRIHIHHLLQMDMDIRALVHRLDVPFDVTVHDYDAICPQLNLLRWSEGIYCGEPGPAVCNACIADQSSHGARDIVSWRRDRAWQFMEADRVICPSADVKARLDRYGIGDRAEVVPHEQQADPFWTVHLPELTALPLRVVLLGVLANHKGARAVAEVAEAAVPGTIELHLIGHLEDSFPKPVVKLIKATGPYQDRDLPALLKKINPQVFWLPSSAPETYSFTLSTAIASGLPIVATDLGSFKERLAGRPYTWLVDHRASANDWLSVFDEVQAALRDRVARPPIPRPVQYSDFYPERYLAPAARPSRPALMSGNRRAGHLASRPRIAIVPERYSTGGLTPCGYIRLLQPLDHLAAAGNLNIILANAETVFDHDVDIIVTQRYAIPDVETVNRLMEHVRRTGAKLLYDLDDDLLAVPNKHPDAATLQPFTKAVRRMLTIADAVWVSTDALAERVASVRPDAMVIENRLDERIWIHGPAPNPFWDDPVRILCMGTTSHDRDFAMIEPALLRLKVEYGQRIVIDVLGMSNRSELPPELNRIGPSTHASRSYPGFVNWLTSMQPRWHIGLAPLLDTPFNRGKSPIKAMDYAAMGLAVLASDTPVYRGSIADGPAGQLVANDHRAWHAAVDWLIRDQHQREIGAGQAREAFLNGATLASHADVRLAALARLLPDPAQIPAVDQGLHQGVKHDIDLRRAPSRPIIPNASVDPTARTRRHSGRGR